MRRVFSTSRGVVTMPAQKQDTHTVSSGGNSADTGELKGLLSHQDWSNIMYAAYSLFSVTGPERVAADKAGHNYKGAGTYCFKKSGGSADWSAATGAHAAQALLLIKARCSRLLATAGTTCSSRAVPCTADTPTNPHTVGVEQDVKSTPAPSDRHTPPYL